MAGCSCSSWFLYLVLDLASILKIKSSDTRYEATKSQRSMLRLFYLKVHFCAQLPPVHWIGTGRKINHSIPDLQIIRNMMFIPESKLSSVSSSIRTFFDWTVGMEELVLCFCWLGKTNFLENCSARSWAWSDIKEVPCLRYMKSILLARHRTCRCFRYRRHDWKGIPLEPRFEVTDPGRIAWRICPLNSW